ADEFAFRKLGVRPAVVEGEAVGIVVFRRGVKNGPEGGNYGIPGVLEVIQASDGVPCRRKNAPGIVPVLVDEHALAAPTESWEEADIIWVATRLEVETTHHGSGVRGMVAGRCLDLITYNQIEY